MYYFASRYQKYDAGGMTGNPMGTGAQPSGLSQGLGIASSAMGLVDAMVPANDYGRKPGGVTIGSAALKGASIGAVAGPWGAAIGAGVGAIAGVITAGSQRRKEQQFEFNQSQQQQNWMQNRSRATLAQNPELSTGYQGASFFADGGLLAKNYLARTQEAEGGSLTPLNSDAVQVNGPDHEQGGVQLPDSNAEVEGGETMQDNFVFSKRLGFAQEHKRIANAIGAIEGKKVMSPERVNSLKRLKDKEQKLMLSQEYLKHTMAHFGQPIDDEQSQAQ